jgi:hypothetical protein
MRNPLLHRQPHHHTKEGYQSDVTPKQSYHKHVLALQLTMCYN